MSTCNNLPPEIIEIILRPLPAKSLGRFKCVSKRWLSFISDLQFIKTHLHNNHHHNNKLILISSTTYFLCSFDINELPQYLDHVSATGKELRFRPSPIWWEEIFGSCNGVVLAKDENRKLNLINPTTRELWEIPISPFALPIQQSIAMYGFGYDSSTDDYKVVSISYWNTDIRHYSDMFVSIYSLRYNSWRKLHNSPYDHARSDPTSGILINEHLHWFVMANPGYSPRIVTFSLANEEFEQIELPDSIDGRKFDNLGVLGGKLVLYGTPLGNGLWVMEEYGVGESWTKVNIHGAGLGYVEPVCLIEGSNGDIVFGNEDRVIVYKNDEGRCRDVRIIGAQSEFFIGGTYAETLESLKRILTL